MKKVLLTIAGFDPSSGAGLSLDLKVFSRFGCYGLAIPTALTIQNSYRVYDYKALSPRLIVETYRRLKTDFKISGLKIGMTGSPRVLTAVKTILADNQGRPVVVDPVFRSSSGRWLLDKNHLASYLKVLAGRMTLFTPNLEEASLLLGRKINQIKQMEKAAREINQLVQAPCLLKGGHLQDQVIDLLDDGQETTVIPKQKLPVNVHGTGCFLSSAILCFLVKGYSLSVACQQASLTVDKFLKSPLTISRRPLFDL